MFDRLKSPRGVTLIELMIVLALLGLVLSVAYSMQNYGLVSFARGESLASQQQNVRNISRTLSEEIRFAREVEILKEIPGSPSASDTFFRASGGDIKKKKGISLEEVFVQGSKDTSYSLEFETVSANPQMVEVVVRVQSPQGNYELSTSVLGLNLQAVVVTGSPPHNVIRIRN